MDWRIIIRPLLEKNMLLAKEGEIIIDKKTGHVTIKHEGRFNSKTKELEGRVNALLGLKNKLLKKFIELADEIDILVASLGEFKDESKVILKDAEEIYSAVIELQLAIEDLLTQVDRFCKEIKTFQYTNLRPYLNSIVANLREILKLQAVLEEMKFLANDIRNQKNSNTTAIGGLS